MAVYEKNEYPIKYALAPIREIMDLGSGSECNWVLFYIVTKCYLVGESIDYYGNGEEKHSYKIVYPCSDSFSSLINKKNNITYPEFKDIVCTNYEVIEKIFDNPFDAYIERSKVNEKQLTHLKRNIYHETVYACKRGKEKTNEIYEKYNYIDSIESFIKEEQDKVMNYTITHAKNQKILNLTNVSSNNIIES